MRITERFGAAVRIHRKHAGLSQEQLALEASLDRTYVSGVERGVRNPSLIVIHRLAQAPKVREDELFRTAYEEVG